ncbi:hypothetical protein ACWCQM_07000 [Streptomyces sp. NPDC002125]
MMTADQTSPARAAAEQLLQQGEHVHYASDGQVLCLSGVCVTVVGP